MMYFSQLVSTMRNPIIAVAVVEDVGRFSTREGCLICHSAVFVSGTTSK